jgi:hypothetical protein
MKSQYYNTDLLTLLTIEYGTELPLSEIILSPKPIRCVRNSSSCHINVNSS